MDLQVKLLEKVHLAQLKEWEYHDEVLLQHYDFRGFLEEDFQRWFRRKQRLITKRIFGVFSHQELIGFITMKKINWMKRRAELGIVFNPGKLSKGYGTEAIKLFLAYYFTELGFEELDLEVADFNRRAMKCYSKCGFSLVSSKVEAFEDQSRNFELLLEYGDLFHLEKQQLMTLVHRMSLTKSHYEEILKP